MNTPCVNAQYVMPTVNGLPLAYPEEPIDDETLRQYLQLLAGQAELRGVDLEASASPLVQ